MKNQGIISFFVFLVGASIIWFMILPTVNATLQARQTLEEQSKAKTQADLLKSKLEGLYSGYGRAFSNAVQYFRAVPETVSQADLMSEIQNIASASNVLISDLQIDVSSLRNNRIGKTANFARQSVAVKLAVTGSYQYLTRFLRVMERNLPLLNGNNVTFTVGGVGKDGSLLPSKLQLEFNTYALR